MADPDLNAPCSVISHSDFVCTIQQLFHSNFQVDKLSKKGSNEDFGAKTLFTSHLTQAEVNRGVKAGKFLQGTFYQSRTNFQEGSFNCESLDKPVLIQGKNLRMYTQLPCKTFFVPAS
jgi:hypothetical protein